MKNGGTKLKAPRRWKYTLTYRLPASFGGHEWSETITGIEATRERSKEVKAQGATRIKIGGKNLV